MRILVIAAILVALLAPHATHAQDAYGCGSELRAKKTLQNSAPGSLGTTPTATTIHALVALAAPADPDAVPYRTHPTETTLFVMRARLQGYTEEADSDYHLLLVDPQTSQSMVGEIPAPACVDRDGALYAQARARVDAIGGHRAPYRRFWWLDYHGATPPLVEVRGYAFYDRIHGQRDEARNGIEIHPIRQIRAL
jgi:hypothetical protein